MCSPHNFCQSAFIIFIIFIILYFFHGFWHRDWSNFELQLSIVNGFLNMISENFLRACECSESDKCPLYSKDGLDLSKDIKCKNGIVNVKGRSLKISVGAAKVLCKLVFARGAVVRKDELLSYGWEHRARVPNNVNVAVVELRTAFSGTCMHIITHRGVGYSLIGGL